MTNVGGLSPLGGSALPGFSVVATFSVAALSAPSLSFLQAEASSSGTRAATIASPGFVGARSGMAINDARFTDLSFAEWRYERTGTYALCRAVYKGSSIPPRVRLVLGQEHAHRSRSTVGAGVERHHAHRRGLCRRWRGTIGAVRPARWIAGRGDRAHGHHGCAG